MKNNQLKIIMIVCILLLITGQSFAEGSGTIKVKPGYEGVVLAGQSVPVEVLVEAQSKDITGMLRVSYRDDDEGIVVKSEMPIQLSKGTEKLFSIPLMIESDVYTYQLSSFLLVEVLDSNEHVMISKKVAVTELIRDDVIAGVLSDRYAGFTYFNLAGVKSLNYDTKDVNTLKLESKHFDEERYLESLDLLVIDGIDTPLSDQGISNLRNWVDDGGILILSTGDQYATQGSIKKLFDLKDYTELKEELVDELENVLMIPFDMPSFNESLTNKGIFTKKIGAGKLIISSYSLSDKKIVGDAGNVERLERILHTQITTENLNRELNPENYNSLRNILNRIPKEDMPSVQLIMFIMVGYLLCVGPIGYFILKQKGQTVYYWRMVSILAIVGTIVVFVAGKGIEFNKTVVNGLTIIDQRNEKTQTTSFLGIKHSGVGTVTLAPENARIKWTGSYMYGEAPKDRTYSYDDREHVTFRGIKKFQFINMMIQNNLSIDNKIQELLLDQKGSGFVLTNPFETALIDVVIIVNGARQYIPRIEGNESIEITSDDPTFIQVNRHWDFYDFYDDMPAEVEDKYQKNNTLQAFFDNERNGRMNVINDIIIIGWLEENTSQIMAVNGVDTLVTGKSLWIDKIELTKPTSGEIILPEGILTPETQLLGEVYYDSYDQSYYGYGDVLFDYQLPDWLELEEVNLLVDNRYGLEYKIYDYLEDAWVLQTVTGEGIVVEKSQITNEKKLQLKITNNGGDAFRGPRIEVKGVAIDD